MLTTTSGPIVPRGDIPECQPNVSRIEIELTTRCNLLCMSCDRRCTQAPSSEDMPIEQIKEFIRESEELSYPWESIGLLGGEPTLHPRIKEIVCLLADYVNSRSRCELFLVSNAHGERVRHVLENIRKTIQVVERPKVKRNDWFNNVDLAPMDFGKPTHACRITSECGLGLTSRGYFPCGPGAAIARVLQIDVGVRSLRQATQENLLKALPTLCACCGHALAVRIGEDDSVSPFWRQAYADYRSRCMRIKE